MTFQELMQAWRTKQAEIKEIERQIHETVMALGKSVEVGDVKASYSAGRKTYDFKEFFAVGCVAVEADFMGIVVIDKPLVAIDGFVHSVGHVVAVVLWRFI